MKRILPFFAVLIAGSCLTGCVHSRAYLAEKERVDQVIPGIPAPEKPRTRQVVVVEFINDAHTPSVEKTLETFQPVQQVDAGQSKVVANPKETVIVHDSNFTFPVMTSETLTRGIPAVSGSVTLPSEYKVEKDDTLQKISKKLYGSFAKWTKIYDANRDLIKDPNRVKPGIILKIPVYDK